MRSSLALIFRRALVLATLAFTLSVFSTAAEASPKGEAFIQNNIRQGLAILNNRSLSEEARKTQFANFLLTLTDMKRIGRYTLGQYRRGASPADVEAFENAFENYATSVYQSYFARYSGQTLKVIGSEPGSDATNEIVRTVLVDPNDRGGQQPPEVDFRVYFDEGAPRVLDFSYGGIWLAETERNDFTGFLGQNGGDIHALIQHLADLTRQFRQTAHQG